MEIVINVDRTELGKCSATRAAEILKKAIAERGNARIVVATGSSSQFEVLDQLVSVEGVDWTKVDGFHLERVHRLGPFACCLVLRLPGQAICRAAAVRSFLLFGWDSRAQASLRGSGRQDQ